jgi:hypothetical protein
MMKRQTKLRQKVREQSQNPGFLCSPVLIEWVHNLICCLIDWPCRGIGTRIQCHEVEFMGNTDLLARVGRVCTPDLGITLN